jgi:hypothetical protein
MKIVATVKGLSLGLWATQRGEDRGESMFTFAICPLQTGQAGLASPLMHFRVCRHKSLALS